ncbi:glycosyltransferase [Arthrobacter polaris]|uniref:glycosyltransferase n=1 Tax=Arthrobacter polaris TaxID=2813727 RepID=UPI003D7CFD08
MPRPELLLLYEHAQVVVVQGGPGSILDARSVGHIPIAVPRRPELHEVVDRHQIAFTRTMAKQGEAIAAESAEELIAALDRALKYPNTMRTEPRTSHPELAGEKLSSTLEHLVTTDSGPMALRRIRQVLTGHRSL